MAERTWPRDFAHVVHCRRCNVEQAFDDHDQWQRAVRAHLDETGHEPRSYSVVSDVPHFDEPPEESEPGEQSSGDQLPVEEMGVDGFPVVALSEPKGSWYVVSLAEVPLYHPLPDDVIEVVHATGRRGVARIQCVNRINKTAHVVPIWFEDEG